jgi:RNA polymerase sigma-70 factor (ECF subfamily)
MAVNTAADRTLTDLARSARDGDRDAFEAIVLAEHARLVGTARAILRDSHEAEDVAQDALVRAHARFGSLRDPSRFRPWLYRILVHLCRDRLRARRPRLLGESVPRVEARPEIGHPRLAALARAMAALPEKYRKPVSLHYVGGLSYREIAQALGLTEKRVKSRLYDARRRLERTVSHDESE